MRDDSARLLLLAAAIGFAAGATIAGRNGRPLFTIQVRHTHELELTSSTRRLGWLERVKLWRATRSKGRAPANGSGVGDKSSQNGARPDSTDDAPST